MKDESKIKSPYRKKSLPEYTKKELIAALNNCELIEASRLGPICAEILKRMNEKSPLFPEKENFTQHRGPIC